MFALLEKLFRSRRAPSAIAPAQTTPSADKPSLYSVVAPVWRVDDHRGVYRGLSGDAIATVKNHDQALTLRDTLNLASGGRPSRRLLDAIYVEETTPLESENNPRA
jgi:hypothetical protein